MKNIFGKKLLILALVLTSIGALAPNEVFARSRNHSASSGHHKDDHHSDHVRSRPRHFTGHHRNHSRGYRRPPVVFVNNYPRYSRSRWLSECSRFDLFYDAYEDAYFCDPSPRHRARSSFEIVISPWGNHGHYRW